MRESEAFQVGLGVILLSGTRISAQMPHVMLRVDVRSMRNEVLTFGHMVESRILPPSRALISKVLVQDRGVWHLRLAGRAQCDKPPKPVGPMDIGATNTSLSNSDQALSLQNAQCFAD